ncbi:hypothetical protein PKB_0294 [Pseudomonas knackmussii B13]|uniref:Uncharacterized protein n=1 Tax=Pseudomonas knackmussii (strain DSM 6978 / CCUG 54928 / LMG 23759 / B13) TaxID=1301098 RepID=A0A024HB20_PSEKB|nr:hypothetical protein [Pseudomonas knackmussii]CDF81673.1 hypothetical protein PKB_0294 [Pseudomonas knackmussii B13]
MTQHTFKRSIEEPLRSGLDWKNTWTDVDQGLIHCWETGRRRAVAEPQLAEACRADELPPLGWKGGVVKLLKKSDKPGSYKYLAEWQGLRGEDLSIDLSQEVSLVCSKTGMTVIFTSDLSKLAGPGGSDEGEDDNG